MEILNKVELRRQIKTLVSCHKPLIIHTPKNMRNQSR